MGLRWYLDAWAVRDGMAFASERDAGSVAQANRSVYIAVPGLEAVPMGSIAPGLWAARASFQDGLFADGEEIGLPDLAAVKEIVRRGYLAGGIGPGPGQPGEPPIEPGPRPDGLSPGQSHLENGLYERHNDFIGSKGIGNPEVRREKFEQFGQKSAEAIMKCLELFAEATVIHWADLLLAQRPDDEEAHNDLGRWMSLLVRTGVLQSLGHVRELLRHVDPRYDFLPGEIYFGAGNWLELGHAENIVFRVPCPLRPRWDRNIRFLSDKLLLAVSTADYFDANPDLPEFVPSLLAAMAVAHQGKTGWPYWRGINRRARLQDGLKWLAAQMPQSELPIQAEQTLSDFAWAELKRR